MQYNVQMLQNYLVSMKLKNMKLVFHLQQLIIHLSICPVYEGGWVKSYENISILVIFGNTYSNVTEKFILRWKLN
jgi:hypothetical protein